VEEGLWPIRRIITGGGGGGFALTCRKGKWVVAKRRAGQEQHVADIGTLVQVFGYRYSPRKRRIL
jgi:hypothetical protein